MSVVVVVVEEVVCRSNRKFCLVMRVVVVVIEEVVCKSNWKCCLLISNRRSSVQVEVKMPLSN